MTNQDIRLQELENWLDEVVSEPTLDLSPASVDASFRRYFRLSTTSKSYVVMDAPPDKEPINLFLLYAAALNKQQVHVPKIYAASEIMGFIVMEDLGRVPYLNVLQKTPDQLYGDALNSLHLIQQGALNQPDLQLASYDANKLDQELDVFEDWYLKRHLDMQLSDSQRVIWQDLKELLINACIEQPQVWVHRDFHSRNLMVTELNNPGVIDFQDMVLGPITYDLVSLLKDCYIEWPRERQLSWCKQFIKSSPICGRIAEEDFIRWYDLTGLQRHLKVLGVFCRLHYRDNKSHYLNDLPLVRKYVRETLPIYPELSYFEALFSKLDHV